MSDRKITVGAALTNASPAGRWLYPVHADGELIGYVARSRDNRREWFHYSTSKRQLYAGFYTRKDAIANMLRPSTAGARGAAPRRGYE